MGYETGLVKYVVKGPFTNPIAFFIYGSFFIAFFNAWTTASAGGNLFDVAIAYWVTKYLPPTSISDIVLPIVAGSVIAGLKWYVNTPKR